MSHAYGIVYDITHKYILGYFEYNGTSDYACSKIQHTREKVSEAWRTDSADGICTCKENNKIPIILYSSYGNGFEWESNYCPKCMVITGSRIRWGNLEHNNLE